MDFSDSESEAEFRAQVRDFLKRNDDRLVKASSRSASAPPPVDATRDDVRQTQRLLADAGYVAVEWPAEHGGGGGTTTEAIIVSEELDRAKIVGLANYIGLHICAPAILKHGTAQQTPHVRRIIRAEEHWCQLFSEPDAGSDLAALRTKAEKRDGSWVINGQKIWTTGAHVSDYGLLLARTGPERHRGLTMFIVDMTTPGVDVRPLRQLSGHSEFNEVFFDDVVLPDTAVLGEVGGGWDVTITMLMNERYAIGGTFDVGANIDDLISLVRTQLPQRPESEAALHHRNIGRAFIASTAVKLANYHQQTIVSKGQDPGPANSANKLLATESVRTTLNAGLDMIAESGLPLPQNWTETLLRLPAMTVAGGTDEILKNIIGDRVLGLKAPRIRVAEGGSAA